MPRLNKVGILITLPIAIFLWFVGWILFWIGSTTRPVNPIKVSGKKTVSFEVLVPEKTLAK
jgi:uncharacterized membrane protein